jgi:hypothetical protein
VDPQVVSGSPVRYIDATTGLEKEEHEISRVLNQSKCVIRTFLQNNCDEENWLKYEPTFSSVGIKCKK